MGFFWDSNWAARIERKLDSLLSNERMQTMTLDDVLVKVGALTTVVDSAEALLATLNQQLQEAIALGDMAKVQAIADSIDANRSELAAAVAANTPGA